MSHLLFPQTSGCPACQSAWPPPVRKKHLNLKQPASSKNIDEMTGKKSSLDDLQLKTVYLIKSLHVMSKSGTCQNIKITTYVHQGFRLSFGNKGFKKLPLTSFCDIILHSWKRSKNVSHHHQNARWWVKPFAFPLKIVRYIQCLLWTTDQKAIIIKLAWQQHYCSCECIV